MFNVCHLHLDWLRATPAAVLKSDPLSAKWDCLYFLEASKFTPTPIIDLILIYDRGLPSELGMEEERENLEASLK